MAIVEFTSVEEFCDELRKEKGNIQRRIVRITNLFTPPHLYRNIRHVKVLATFVVGPFTSALVPAEAQIIRLERYCGDVWGIQVQDDPVFERSRKATEQIEAVCKELGLEVRPGVIEEAEA